MSRRVLLVGLLALAFAQPAWGHAILVASSPANGAVVARAPAAVRVTFNSAVKVAPGTAAVRNSNGANVLGGRPSVTGAGDIMLVVPLRPVLPAGDYTVRWSIVSEIDGHQQQGVIAFAVGASAGAPTAALSAKGFVTWKTVAMRTVFYLGILGAVGTAFFAVVVLRPLRLEPELAVPQARLSLAWFSLALIGCIALLATESVGGTNFSRAVTVAAVAAGVGIVAAALTPRARQLRYAGWAAAAVLLVCPTLSGHALDPTQPRALAPIVDVFHLGAAAVWLGGLSALAFTLGGVPDRLRGRVVRRFSALALVSVCVVAVTGLSRALTEFTSVRQVWSTSYGDALLVKTGLFAVLILLGWRSRSILAGAFERLRASVLIELAVLSGVIVAVGALTDLPPGRDAAAHPAAPAPPPILQPPLPARGAFTEGQQAGPYAVGLAVQAGSAKVTVIGPEGTAPNGVVVSIDGHATTKCGVGCFAAPIGGRTVAVGVAHRLLRFRLPAVRRPAAAVLRRVTKAFTGLRDLEIEQVLSSRPGLTQVTRYRERAPNALAYVITKDTQRTATGTAAIEIGRRRWDRAPGGRWIASVQAPIKVPSPWWGPDSRNAYLIAPNQIAFFDPRIPAWFRLTFARGNDRPVRLGMIAAAHFMTETYSGMNRPLRLTPP